MREAVNLICVLGHATMLQLRKYNREKGGLILFLP